MAKISILTFKRNIYGDICLPVPSELEHWGLYVEYSENKKIFYHVNKTSIIDTRTSYETRSWINLRKENVDFIIIVGYSANLTPEQMNELCSEVSFERHFNTLTNNCQEWIKSVLKELVNTEKIPKFYLERLEELNLITPLRGWKW
jgi:hypothetical protein